MEYRSEIHASRLARMNKEEYSKLSETLKLDLFFQLTYPDRKHDTVIIVKKKKGRKMLDAGREYTSRAPANLPRQYRSPLNDYYLGKNTFKNLSSKACIKDLQALGNIVIDIDCHKKMGVTVYEKRLDGLKAQIEECLEKESLPPFTYLVETGRGVQIWWTISPCYASKKNIGIYRSVASWLCSLLKKYVAAPFEVDTAASVNPAGLVRFPGTFNQKGFHKKVILCFRQPFRMSMHGFFEKHREEIIKAFPISKKRYKAAGGNRGLAAAMARLDGLIRVIRARDCPAGQEMRDVNLFCAYCFFSRLMEPEQIYSQVIEKVNKCFKEPMPEKEYRRYLSSALKKQMVISNLTVAQKLNYSQEEMALFGMRVGGVRKKIKPPCRYRGRNRDILACLRAGMKDAECAREVGCSKTTVRNVRKKYGIASWGVRIRKRVQELLGRGLRKSKVARLAGCCRDTVYRALAELERKSRAPGLIYRKPPVIKAIGRAYAGKAFQGMTQEQKKDAFAKGYAAGLRYDRDRMEVYSLSETATLCI